MRKIRGQDAGSLYAMKVLKKATLKGKYIFRLLYASSFYTICSYLSSSPDPTLLTPKQRIYLLTNQIVSDEKPHERIQRLVELALIGEKICENSDSLFRNL